MIRIFSSLFQMLIQLTRLWLIGFFLKFILTIALLAGGWMVFFSREALSPLRQKAVHGAVEEFLVRSPRPAEILPLAVMELDGDVTGEVSRSLRKRLDREEAWQVRGTPLAEWALHKIGWSATAFTSLDEALCHAGGAGMVLWGRVNEFSQHGERVTLDLDLGIYEVESGRPFCRERVRWTNCPAPLPPAPALAAVDRGGPFPLARLGLLLLAGSVLPWVLRPLILRALAAQSNRVNALLLAGLLAADGTLVWLMMGGAVAAWLLTWVVLFWALFMGWYNYAVCQMLEKSA